MLEKKSRNGMITIDPYGDVYTCWDVIGNKDQAVGKIDFENQTINYTDKLKLWTDRSTDVVSGCGDCKYALFCEGGCAAHANVITGNYNKSYCQNFKEIFDEVIVGMYDEYFCKNKSEKKQTEAIKI